MKKILAFLLCIVLYITGKSFAESDELINAVIVIFSGSVVLFLPDYYYGAKSIITALCLTAAGTLLFVGKDLFYFVMNSFSVVLFIIVMGKEDFNVCKLFFTFFRKKITKYQRLEFDSCNECRLRDMKLESGDCLLFGIIPTGIKWTQKTCRQCNHFQQGELFFLGHKINYGKLLGFFKAK